MNAADSTLCRLAGQMAACHWLPVNYPLGGKVLNDVCCLAWTLPVEGLPFQSRSRDDRAALDALRRAGLVHVEGATSGIHVALTPTGAACIWDMGQAVEDMVLLGELSSIKTPWGADVIPGFTLCPTAGPWWTAARATDAGWAVYQDELQLTMTMLLPLLVLGWAHQFVSANQMLWAVQLTDAGRLAATEAAPTEPTGFCFDADAFTDGRTQAKRRFSSPPDSGSVVARMLPSSKWI